MVLKRPRNLLGTVMLSKQAGPVVNVQGGAGLWPHRCLGKHHLRAVPGGPRWPACGSKVLAGAAPPGWQAAWVAGRAAAHTDCFHTPFSPCQLQAKVESHTASVVYSAKIELCWSHLASLVSGEEQAMICPIYLRTRDFHAQRG